MPFWLKIGREIFFALAMPRITRSTLSVWNPGARGVGAARTAAIGSLHVVAWKSDALTLVLGQPYIVAVWAFHRAAARY